MGGRRFKKREKKINIKKIIILLVIILILFSIKPIFNFFSNKLGKYSANRVIPIEYRALMSNGKFGVIDTKGNEVIKPKYDEMLVIPNPTKDLFITSKDGLSIVLNKNSNQILKKYTNIYPIEYKNGYDLNLLKVKDNSNKYFLVDYLGDKKIPDAFEEIEVMQGIDNALKVKQDGKFGIVNTKTLTYVVPPIYVSVNPTNSNNDTLYIVENEGFYGVVDKNSKKVLETNYKEIHKTKSVDYVVAKKEEENHIYDIQGKDYGAFSGEIIDVKDGAVIRRKSERVGVSNLDGDEIIPYKYDDIRKISSSMYVVKLDGRENILNYDKDKKEISDKKLPKDYDKIKNIEGTNIIIATLDNKDDIYNTDLEKKLEGIVVDINKDDFILNVDGKEKVYNFNFQEQEKMKSYEQNLFAFSDNGKFGLKDSKNHVVVKPIYDEILQQNKFGFVAIKRENKWGCVDINGNIVVEPSLEMKDSQYIDFIGKYHLYKYADLLIYTDK